MAIDSKELLNHLRFIAPRELEEDWDNGGFQIRMRKAEAKKVLICLEITHQVIEEAAAAGVDHIVTHHPLLFHKLDVIDRGTVTGSYLIRLIKEGITVYSAHTAFDSVFGGNNDYLADLLGLEKVRKLKYRTPFGDVEKIGRIGTWSKPLSLAAAAVRVEEALELTDAVRVVGDRKRLVETVAICTGAGDDAIDAVVQNDCDLFITGDVRHHDAQKARELGLALIDAGHYGTEKIFTRNFAEKLRKLCGDQIEIIESNVIVDPFDSMI